MSGVEMSYLAAWSLVAALLVVSGGIAVLLTPVAVLSGLYRAHAWRVAGGLHLHHGSSRGEVA